MANAFLNAKEYANAMLLLLTNNLVYGGLVDGSLENKVTDENGLKIYKKRPPRFIAGTNAALAAQDIVIGEESVTVDQYKNVHISIGDLEAVQSFNQLVRSNVMKEAALTLSHNVDSYIAGLVRKFPSWVGTPGEAIATPQEFNKGYTRLMNQSVPDTDLNATITYEDAELIRGDLIDTNINQINKSALQKSRVPVLSQIDVFATQQIPSLTFGDRETAGTVSGANQHVNYRAVKDNPQLSQEIDLASVGNNAEIKAGEVFTIADVLAWQSRAGQALPYEQQFTVLEDATADGSGNVTLTITPPIIVPGTNDGVSTVANTAFATVNSIPADTAVVTFLGTAEATVPQNAAFQKGAIALVSAKLQMPFTGVASYAKDPKTGIYVRYWRGSDITTGAHIHRWDMIYGAEVMDNRLGTRIAGQS